MIQIFGFVPKVIDGEKAFSGFSEHQHWLQRLRWPTSPQSQFLVPGQLLLMEDDYTHDPVKGSMREI
jgi:hypothetical protein